MVKPLVLQEDDCFLSATLRRALDLDCRLYHWHHPGAGGECLWTRDGTYGTYFHLFETTSTPEDRRYIQGLVPPLRERLLALQKSVAARIAPVQDRSGFCHIWFVHNDLYRPIVQIRIVAALGLGDPAPPSRFTRALVGAAFGEELTDSVLAMSSLRGR
jgi:hypothetical protein